MATRILIAHDHAALRATLRALLDDEPDLVVVGEATHAGEVLRLSGHVCPDIVLVDMGLPGLQGFDSLRQLICALPRSQVLLLTDYDDIDMLRNALLAGVSGCLVGRTAESTLVAAIRAVSTGELYMQPWMMRALLADRLSQPSSSEVQIAELTPREVDVLRLIAQGRTNRQVAEELCLSIWAVESYRENIMTKLGLRSRVQLMRFAAARRLIDAS